MIRKTYKVVGLGGTFDHLHKGHEKLFELAIDLGQEIMIGLTDGAFAEGKAQDLQHFHHRKRAIEKWFQKKGLNPRIFPLSDPYGPILDKTEIKALIVSPETAATAQKANEIRLRMNLRPLEIHQVQWVLDENGQPIHSTRIRSGEVSASGRVYANILKKDILLNESQRNFFSKPLHKVLQTAEVSELLSEKPQLTYIVGDGVLNTALEHNWPIDLGIFDLLQQREPSHSPAITDIAPDITVHNPAGTLSVELSQAVITGIRDSLHYIKVIGEEDLAAVAAILAAPLNSYVIYGQPKKGIVALIITPTLKDQVYDTLSR